MTAKKPEEPKVEAPKPTPKPAEPKTQDELTDAQRAKALTMVGIDPEETETDNG